MLSSLNACKFECLQVWMLSCSTHISLSQSTVCCTQTPRLVHWGQGQIFQSKSERLSQRGPINWYKRKVSESERISQRVGPKGLTLLSFILHSLICRSSAPLMISGMLGWKLAQFTPLVEKKHLKRQNKDKHLI